MPDAQSGAQEIPLPAGRPAKGQEPDVRPAGSGTVEPSPNDAPPPQIDARVDLGPDAAAAPAIVPPASAGEAPATIVIAKAPGTDGAMELMVASEVLRRVNRSRQVVSLVSQVIIRAYEEEALLAETCRHLVAFGGYLMAWVGMAEKEPGHPVRPVAHAGLEPNFLQVLEIAWTGDVGDRGPTNRAILEQRPFVARNILKEPRYAVLREEAKLHGYTATCALPLQFGQYGLGVLTIHAAEPEAFGAEEVSLLRELAGDLSAGVIGLRDRSRREALEEKAAQIQARYASIIDNSREGIFQSTPEGKLVLVNNALVRLLGYGSKEELLAVIPPVILTHVHPDYVKTAETGMFVPEGGEPFACLMHTKTGGWIWVDIIAKTVQEQDEAIVQGFVQDTTARHAHAQASARLAAVVDAADDAIIGTDLEGRVTDWNAGAARLFGYERSEVLGRPTAEFMIPEGQRNEDKRIRQAIGNGERVPRFETVRMCKEGRRIHTSVAISPIFGTGGEVIGSTTVEHDITAVRAAEAGRLAAQMEETEVRRLKGIEAVRRTFISTASHELNTPLTPLRIHVEALAERPDVTREQREHILVIERNVLRLSDLVKDMLEASRLETGRFNLDLRDVPLASLVQEAIDTMAETAAQAGVTLVAGPRSLIMANADRNRVGQVLFNLLGNAVAFTPAGGNIKVGIAVETGQAVIRVTDTGLGLSPEQIGQLFQPFSRPHERQGAGPKGTGLGLFICKGIVEQHGGRIWAESEGPGEGSSFCFSLPLASPPTSTNPPPAHGIPTALAGTRHRNRNR